jgi:hypothetical protein
MTSSNQFNAFVAARGEGLHPKLRDLLERAVASPHSDVSVRHDGLLQAGPSPAFRNGSIARQSSIVPARKAVCRYRARTGDPEASKMGTVKHFAFLGAAGTSMSAQSEI